MNLAQQALELHDSAVTDDEHLAAISEMTRRDPKGLGSLDRANGVIRFVFSDGSKLFLDLERGSFYIPNN